MAPQKDVLDTPSQSFWRLPRRPNACRLLSLAARLAAAKRTSLLLRSRPSRSSFKDGPLLIETGRGLGRSLRPTPFTRDTVRTISFRPSALMPTRRLCRPCTPEPRPLAPSSRRRLRPLIASQIGLATCRLLERRQILLVPALMQVANRLRPRSPSRPYPQSGLTRAVATPSDTKAVGERSRRATRERAVTAPTPMRTLLTKSRPSHSTVPRN